MVCKCRHTPNFACIDMGFGIGVGLVHNGMLYRGANECSGEIGHTVVEPNGTKCKCGKTGCLETVVKGHFAKMGTVLRKGFTKFKYRGGKGFFEARGLSFELKMAILGLIVDIKD